MSDIPPSTIPPISQAYSVSPLQTDTVWNVLPVPLTEFIGREREIDHICALMTARGTRLLTLTGPGGIGKTRLAIEAATRLAPEFAHGACFVALAAVRDPGLVADTVAEALGLRERGEACAENTLMSMFRDRHLLLVLDNLEHVVRGTALWLADLFTACPMLQVLVTSRIAVQIDGEQRYIVPPLPLPTGGTNEDLSDNAAVRLFAQRARAVNPKFILTTGHTGVVAEICRRLECLPLAIELAASRVSMLSPPAILARLSECPSLLSCNRQDAPNRHRTMHDAIAWSYNLLPPDEQGLFRHLTVFVGGFSLEAAEVVGGPMALDMLTMLVDHSLERCLPSPSKEPRMAMYETIREFGLQQLVAREEEVAACDAHAAYFLQKGVEANWGVKSSTRLEWCAPFTVEQENLKAAIGWLMQRERFEEAKKLAIDTIGCLWIPRLDSESRDFVECVLAHLQSATRTGGAANVSGDIHGIEPMMGDPSRVRIAADEAFYAYADPGAVNGSITGNGRVIAAFGDHPVRQGEDGVREAFGSTSSYAPAEPPGQSLMADAPMGLTPRELDVLRLMADGLTNQEIADMLFLSLRTVTSHVTRVLTKLAVPSRTAAVSHAIRQGII